MTDLSKLRTLITACLFVLASSVLLPSAAHAQQAGERVIVLDSAGAQLTLIDPVTRQVVGKMATGKEPHHLMITPDHKSLIIANSVSNSLMFVDPRTGRLQRTLEDIPDPYQLAFSPNGKWFVTAALRLNRVDIYHYDGKNFTVAKRIELAETPSHLNFSTDGKIVFVTLQGTGELAAIDVASQTLLWRMPVGSAPAGLWMVPGDRYLLVGMTGEDDVAVVDWHNRRVIKRIPTGRGAHNFRSLDDGEHVAVSNRVSNTISILNYRTLTDDGNITGLLPGPDDMELSKDRRFLWVTFRFARHVGVIDMTTRRLVTVIAVGRSPHGIYFVDNAPPIGANPD